MDVKARSRSSSTGSRSRRPRSRMPPAAIRRFAIICARSSTLPTTSSPGRTSGTPRRSRSTDVDVLVVLGDVSEKDDPNDVLKRVHDVLVEKYGESRVDDRPTGGPRRFRAREQPGRRQGHEHRGRAGLSKGRLLPDRGSCQERLDVDRSDSPRDADDRRQQGVLGRVEAAGQDDQGVEPQPGRAGRAVVPDRGHGAQTDPRGVDRVVPARDPGILRRPPPSGSTRAWADPAGLGSPVSDQLHLDALALEQARVALRDAERQCGEAIRLEKSSGSARRTTPGRRLFGPLFAKS